MLFVFCDRYELISLLGHQPEINMLELGVWEGEFSEFCNQVLRPKQLTLVDSWAYEQYKTVPAGAPQMQNIEQNLKAYFGDFPEQALEAAYLKVQHRFAACSNVKILREKTWDAANHFKDGELDIIYLDANHRYEYVLGDLYTWYPKLKPGGLFFCNDFWEAQQSIDQNFGVIPAYQTFAKRFEAYPIALTASHYSDFCFSNLPTSYFLDNFKKAILSSSFNKLALPNELIGNYRHYVTHSNIKPIPSFQL